MILLFLVFISSVMISLCLAFEISSISSFNLNTANTSLYLSSASYCTGTIMNRTYDGAGEGFIPYVTIDDDKTDTHGMIGYRDVDETIYVVFRGSEDIQNWINDVQVTLTEYPYCEKCKVHKGWYTDVKTVIDKLKSELASLVEKYPTYKILVTGHSLGAALAALTLVELQCINTNIESYTFGSPRIGNTAYSDWFDEQLYSYYRVTHHKDTVVHIPMHERYTHVSGEWYHESDVDASDLRLCIEGPEDPSCSYQWHITDPDDHLKYFGQHVGCPDNAR